MENYIHVAVGIIVNEYKQILVAQRLEPVHLANLWEFPGGKVEEGEQVADALARELNEEVGIEVICASPLEQFRYSYPEKNVCLDVWLVHEFSGVPKGIEGQPIRWIAKEEFNKLQFLPANSQIIQMLHHRLN